MMAAKSLYSITALAIALTLTACTDEKEKPVENLPVKVVDTIGIQHDNNAFVSWEEFYKNNDVTFSLDSFMKTDTVKGELLTVSYVAPDTFYQQFGNLIVYNQDSTQFIDAYSTAWISEKGADGKYHMRESDPDQEVVIVNLKNKIKTRILYCGPGCQVQKTFWYNENVVGIMGVITEYADEYYTPVIWFVNIHNGITIPYYYNSTVSILDASDFLKRHLESKGVIVD